MTEYSENTSPLISVIIVNYNGGDRLQRCLDALSRQSFRDFEVIVIDNASADNSIELAKSAEQDFTLIDAGENLGFAAGNNRAVDHACGGWLAFLNPDAYAEPDWLEELISATKRYPDAEAFGSTQVNADDPSRLDGAGDVYHVFGAVYRGHYNWPTESLPAEGDCFAPCAAAAMYKRSAFDALGGFEESYFCYCEDVDLAFRLRLGGGRIVQVATAVVRHEGSGITGKSSDFSIYHGHRNRVWMLYRCTPLLLLIATLPFHYMLNAYLMLRFAIEGQGGVYYRAMRDAHAELGTQLKARRRIQATRTASTGAIARAMTWSLIKLARKQADLK